jgi:putative transposase
MNKYHQPLQPDGIYHLFSRAVGSEKLFPNKDNYYFFLQKLKQHTSPVCQLYCYSLLPNHFHLLTKIQDEACLIRSFEKVKKESYKELEHDLTDFVMERFSNFLNSYSKSFNKVNRRRGALFMDYLKRSKTKNDIDFTAFVWYIHKNAVHHQLVKSVGEWKFDSYNSILSSAPTSLLREEILEWFGGKEKFVEFHQQKIYPKNADFYDI